MKRTPLKRKTRLKSRNNNSRAKKVAHLDWLWRECIRGLHGNRCIKTGSRNIECCHLIHRGGNPFLRWEIPNGIPLTPYWHAALDGRNEHHEEFMSWFKVAYSCRYRWMQEHRHAGRDGKTLDDVEKELANTLKRLQK